MGEAVPYIKKTKQRLSVTKWAKIIAAFCVVVAAILAMGGLYLKQQEVAQANAAAAKEYSPAPLPVRTGISTKAVSVLSDSHANNADSWWRQTVAASAVAGLSMAAFESQPGAETSSLLPRLDAATAGADMVIVQAGTNDLLAGKSAEEAGEGVFALWDGVAERNAQPVAALVPPSDSKPGAVIELNRFVREEAQRRGMPVIDVYTPVAAEDGSWGDGLSGDGVHSNGAGSDLMAEAAKGQLTSLR